MTEPSRHLEYARKYLAQGFTLIRLYQATADGCSCADRGECAAPGKHSPDEWGNPNNRITSEDQAERAFRSGAWNVGIVCGSVSGVFVVDVDTKKNGFESFRRLQDDHEPLPYTLTHSSGSGGHHYFLRFPQDVVITNATKSLRELGYTGIDIRGEGGYVVAPPSTTDHGDYAVKVRAEIADSPLWLTELLTTTKSLRELTVTQADDLPDFEELPDDVAELAENYARKALREEIKRLDAAREDDEAEWNNLTNEIAYKLFTLANSPWNTLEFGEVADEMSDHALVDEGSSFERFERTVRSAFAAVQRDDLARPLPDVVVVALDRIREDESDELSCFDGRLYSDAELDNIPDLEPLIDDMLYLGSTARLFGASTHGKSFVALDMAACVGTGTDWHGKRVTPSRVLYVVAEGEQGVRKRVKLWKQHFGKTTTNITFMPEAFQINQTNREWAKFIKLCQREEFKLIVFDTQARVTLGIEENSNTEFGQVIAMADALYKATGACVLLVHHTGNENSDRSRGNSSTKAALQTEIQVKRDKQAGTVMVAPTKQKDDEEIKVMLDWTIKDVEGEFKRDGSPVRSVVLTTPFLQLSNSPSKVAASSGYWVSRLVQQSGHESWGHARVLTYIESMNGGATSVPRSDKIIAGMNI